MKRIKKKGIIHLLSSFPTTFFDVLARGAFKSFEGKVRAFAVFSFWLKVKFKSYHCFFNKHMEFKFLIPFRLGSFEFFFIFSRVFGI